MNFYIVYIITVICLDCVVFKIDDVTQKNKNEEDEQYGIIRDILI